MPRGVEVLRERDFRLVYGAQVVSLLGDGIIPVALAFAVLDLTGSATDLGEANIPPDALSRGSAYDWFGSLTFQPIRLALAGPIAAQIGVAATLWVAAGLELCLVASLLLVRDVRTLGASGPRGRVGAAGR